MKIRTGFSTLPGLNLLVASLFLFCAVSCPRAASAEWAQRYNGPANGDDSAYAVAVDIAGNVYVTGRSQGASSGSDYTTVKYDMNGARKWVRRYNGPANRHDRAAAIAVDIAGNVYVTGESQGASSGSDYATVKYDSNGNQKWAQRYSAPGNRSDSAVAVAVDIAGNVYVTGTSQGASSGSDYATVKYDPNGIQKWVKRYNGPENHDDRAVGVAVDLLGNVYVTGYSYCVSSDWDYLTVKYDSNGNRKWVRRYNGPGKDSDQAAAIAVDFSGNVYVTGYSCGVSSSSDYTTVKYDSNGKRKWIKRYNGVWNSIDCAVALALDAEGNVLVTGYSGSFAVGYDFATVKYDTNGRQKWLKLFSGPYYFSSDYPTGVAVDLEGNVYVTGCAKNTSPFYYNYATVKYDRNGNEQWLKAYDVAREQDEYASAVAVDVFGNVYVTGYSEQLPSGTDYVTVKYDTNGN